MVKHSYLMLLCICIFFLISCSSAPPPPDEILTDRNRAARQIDLANQAANRGRYDEALFFAEEAWRLAISCDDPYLISRTGMTRANILFSLGRHDEAFRDWGEALEEAEREGLADLLLLTRIYTARGRLMLMENPQVPAVEEIRDQVNSYTAAIRSDPYGQAAGWLVLGMAEKELKRFAEAERAARRSLDYYEKNLNLEDAAYAWYFIASVHSVEGRYNDALAALHNAISFDRRAENGFGLASSWQAMGNVHLKAGNTAQAARAFRRAADIYRANGLDEAADKAAALAGL
jgi:tetratricopeptide (TPR) repeat protein